jgi:hypothetical protein|tara:strand:- start:5069 stop:5209 length:141 start_codon:yes stop_codon:yes gene_type:complete
VPKEHPAGLKAPQSRAAFILLGGKRWIESRPIIAAHDLHADECATM